MPHAGTMQLKIINSLFLLLTMAHNSKPAIASDNDDLDYVILGMKSARASLVSGTVEITKKRYIPGESSKSKPQTEEIFIAFDGADKIRFDKRSSQLVPITTHSSSDEKSPQKFSTVEGYMSRFYRNGQKCAIFNDGMTTVVVDSKEHCDSKSIEFFDPKSIGIYNESTLRSGALICNLDKIFWFDQKYLKSVDKSAGDIWQLTFDYNNGARPAAIMQNVKVNVAKGFSPCAVEYFFKSKNGEWKPNERIDTEWSNVSDHWVPIHSKISTPGVADVTEYNLKWTSINKSVPNKFFSLKDLKIPNSATIGTFENGSFIVMQTGEDLHGPDEIRVIQEGSLNRILMTSTLVLVIGMGIAMVYFYFLKAKGT